ncbi:MAG: hypothetical protein A2381_05370 [Bdellovibrionales bacterium RIFOXYB1_FULL_37_110]|nr:MAG: hypothetical protein A2417_16850 [Bdellovibrionales bacterium RIFOXYC1_FULL_37_79]OFZ58176.1 MAG: hypothetical protein A2381_05370 [Bdellovibrionales bacterium RIFOXYB1_FULL_37_110]OFZ61865.1 MAG: hypothetical protein A2577_18955 [Bdellovibrionales bacterium RIFOXYD1_FULL_36_51]
MTLPSFKFRNQSIQFPIIQGGMGIGFSNHLLAGTVSKYGGLGVISSAALDSVVSFRLKGEYSTRKACAREVSDAKKISEGRPIGMNIMVATVNQYDDSVLGSMDGGVDVIISGAGLPTKLPGIVSTHPRAQEVALVPIVSSARALQIIIKKWEKYHRLPDAVVVEGPLAGGHIGWTKKEDAYADHNKLENLVSEVLELTHQYDIPLIAAGGIHNYHDIKKYLNMGCAAVQMGTRFLATFESGASQNYKNHLVKCTKNDIDLADIPGSPCKLLFRVIKTSPFYQQALHKDRIPLCNKGYILVNGVCAAQNNTDCFCICNGLLASSSIETNELELYTVGGRADEITQIISVQDLMQELITNPDILLCNQMVCNM